MHIVKPTTNKNLSSPQKKVPVGMNRPSCLEQVKTKGPRKITRISKCMFSVSFGYIAGSCFDRSLHVSHGGYGRQEFKPRALNVNQAKGLFRKPKDNTYGRSVFIQILMHTLQQFKSTNKTQSSVKRHYLENKNTFAYHKTRHIYFCTYGPLHGRSFRSGVTRLK